MQTPLIAIWQDLDVVLISTEDLWNLHPFIGCSGEWPVDRLGKHETGADYLNSKEAAN